MEHFNNFRDDRASLIKQYYQPDFKDLFYKIKDIKAPVKSELLMVLLDGQWHSETELIRIARKQQKYMGRVTLGTMMHMLNQNLKSNYVEKKFMNGEMYYKISDNYIGLSRAACSRYRFSLK
ncbi:MAG: hypothetical protein ACP6IY_14340 [Promethearchaeia archaeon]